MEFVSLILDNLLVPTIGWIGYVSIQIELLRRDVKFLVENEKKSVTIINDNITSVIKQRNRSIEQ